MAICMIFAVYIAIHLIGLYGMEALPKLSEMLHSVASSC